MTASAPAPGRVRTPDGTTALFVLLIAAVAATAATAFFTLQKAYLDVRLSEIEAIGAGLVLIFGLAGVLYWVTPRWTCRRRRLRRIDPSGSPELLDDLVGLCEVAGVRPPVFLLAAKRQSTQAVAFGHVGRRYVQVNAGLVKESVLAPATFRAIVLHELAHLRNRDVDIALLTVAVWRSFVVLALPVMAASTVKVFLTGRGSAADTLLGRVPLVISLVVLTLLVYLTRNAVLRLREHHADLRSAAWEAPDGTLGPASRAALAGLFARAAERYRGRLARLLAKHPRPAARIAVLDDPLLVSRPRLGQLFGVGVAAAVCLENAFLPLGRALEGIPSLSSLVNVLVVGAFVCLTLVFAVFRTGVRGDLPPIRVLAFPLVLMAGFLVGDAASLINTAAGTWVMFGQYGGAGTGVAVTVLPLVVGTVLVTAWARSVAAGVALRRRRTWYALGLVATLAVTPWFNVWFSLRQNVSQTLADALGRPGSFAQPLPDAVTGWYASVAGAVQNVALWPQDLLFFRASFYYPWVALGILLTAVVPLLLARRTGWARRDLRRALLLGFAGAVVCVLFFALHLTLIEAAYQPDRDRDAIGEWVRGGLRVFLAVSVLVEAVVAGTVMAVARRMPLVPALAALSVTATLTTVVVTFGAMPGHCAVLVESMVDPCWSPASLDTASLFWHQSLVLGVVAAVPAVAVGALVARLVRRRRAGTPPPVEGPANRVLSVAGGLLLVATLGAAAGVNHGRWVPFLPAEEPASVDDCLIGRWRETSYRFLFRLDDLAVELSRRDVTHEFRPDGTSVVDFGERTVESGTYNGHVLALEHHGTVVRDFRAEDGSISYGTDDSAAWFVITVDGQQVGGKRRALVPEYESAECAGDRATLAQGDSYRAVLTRVS